MRFIGSLAATVLLAHSCTAGSVLPKKQQAPRQVSSANLPLASSSYGKVTSAAPAPVTPRPPVEDRAQQIKDAFVFAFDGYLEYAFPADQLKPISLQPTNPRNGWGASAIDGLDTALVMGLGDIANTILDYIPSVNFGVSIDNEAVSLFETTIRYVGGLLSAYDLLHDGPLASLATNPQNVEALLSQAEGLANNLSYAFETPSGIPQNNLYFNNRSNDGATTNGLATAGTLVMEWTRLSDLSGNTTYAELSQKAESYLINPNPEGVAFPGLVGQNIGIADGRFQDAFGGWIGGSDSFFEYLIKMYIYDPVRFESYRDFWVLAADSSISKLASHPSSRTDLTYLAEYNGQQLILESEHLACFDGGNFLLGGQVLNRPDYVQFGLALTDACHNTYNSTLTKIGPETFDWDASSVPADQLDFYNEHGFYITNPAYDLRPEVIESYYYAYQITGNTTYQDWAWDAFVAINQYTRAPQGFSQISDINAPNGGTQADNQESFLFAETFKYLYLINAPQAVYDVAQGATGRNMWVFNTEAHPFKIAPTAAK